MFNYKWYLADDYKVEGVKKNNLNVFSTFACGGGSSMGYKLAGYNVIGANDIDKQMEKVYKKNLKPELYYLSDIRDFNKQIKNKEVDKRLFDLDILDGSPPCSTFSMAGSREKAWNIEKKFREGQSKQRLDDLFFEFIETARLLKPKVVIGENVKGMIQGNAKGYVLQIKKELNNIGYDVQLFLLNAASMGVPQKRERVFIIARRRDLDLDELKLSFNEKPILFKEIDEGDIGYENKMSKTEKKYWEMTLPGQALSSVHPKGHYFGFRKLSKNKVANTILAGSTSAHPNYPRKLNDTELIKIGSFPLDYDFLDVKPQYLIGMSVPPLMTAQVANQIYLQWLK
jgi:DNA (cytosine-5)-methyltransferase 1